MNAKQMRILVSCLRNEAWLSVYGAAWVVQYVEKLSELHDLHELRKGQA